MKILQQDQQRPAIELVEVTPGDVQKFADWIVSTYSGTQSSVTQARHRMRALMPAVEMAVADGERNSIDQMTDDFVRAGLVVSKGDADMSSLEPLYVESLNDEPHFDFDDANTVTWWQRWQESTGTEAEATAQSESSNVVQMMCGDPARGETQSLVDFDEVYCAVCGVYMLVRSTNAANARKYGKPIVCGSCEHKALKDAVAAKERVEPPAPVEQSKATGWGEEANCPGCGAELWVTIPMWNRHKETGCPLLCSDCQEKAATPATGSRIVEIAQRWINETESRAVPKKLRRSIRRELKAMSKAELMDVATDTLARRVMVRGVMLEFAGIVEERLQAHFQPEVSDGESAPSVAAVIRRATYGLRAAHDVLAPFRDAYVGREEVEEVREWIDEARDAVRLLSDLLHQPGQQ